MNLVLHSVLFGVLLVSTVAVSLYRKWLEDHCANYLHLHSDTHDAAIVSTQSNLCRKLEIIDKVKTGLIAATIVYGVAIAGFATYNAWVTSGRMQ